LQGQVATLRDQYLTDSSNLVQLQESVSILQNQSIAGVSELENVNNQLSMLRGDLSMATERYATAQQNILSATEQLGEIQSRIATGQTDLTGLEASIGMSQAELSGLQNQIEAGRQAQAQLSQNVSVTQSEYAELQAQVSLGNQALSTLQTAISTAQASYALLQQQIGGVGAGGSDLANQYAGFASNQIITPEFKAMATSLQQSLDEATNSSNEWLKIVKSMLAVVKAGLAGFLGIWATISNLGRSRANPPMRPTTPGTILPPPGSQTYFAGFPPIPGVPDWLTGAGYGLAFVALILMGAKIAKDQKKK
jgi:chromosome segregation ATPase